MKNEKYKAIILVGLSVFLVAIILLKYHNLLSFFVPLVFAHCDTLDGPVVKDAKTALENGDITPVLKWVKPEHETEIKAAFNKTLIERNKSPEAKEKVKMKFFEALVRLHREGEGASFTGLRPAGEVEPIIAEADKALESGSADGLTAEMSEHLIHEVKERFERTLEAKRHKDESVAAGREYVEAYVEYVHYIEGLHKVIAGKASHHEE